MKIQIRCFLRRESSLLVPQVILFLTIMMGLASVSVAQFPPTAPTPQVNAAVNAASFVGGAPLSGGVLFSIFGASMSDGSTAAAQSTPLPTRLAGATVLVNGVAAPLFFASPGQINAQFPVELATVTSADIQVQLQTGSLTVTSLPLRVSVRPVSPGLFSRNQNGIGAGAILRNSDFIPICPEGRSDCQTNFAVPGDVLAIFAIGLGPVSGTFLSGQTTSQAAPTLTAPTVAIGGAPAQVLFAGLAAGFVGLYQVNVAVPNNVPIASAVPVVLSMGGRFSNAVTIATGHSDPLQSIVPPGGGPPAGTIQTLAIDPTNSAALYAGTWGYGMYKSTNGAASWNPINIGLSNNNSIYISSMVIDPTSPSTVYIGTGGGGVYKSLDGGTNWNPSNNGLPSEGQAGILGLDAGNPAILYASGGGGALYRSNNGAASWTRLTLPANYLTVGIDPNNPGTLYAVGGDVYKSTNGGTSWTRISTGQLPAGFLVTASFAIDPSNSNTLYVSVFIDSAAAVYKSTDGGVTFRKITAANLSNKPLAGITIDPSNPSSLYGTINNIVFKSTNGGGVWSQASSGMTNPNTNALVIDPGHSSTLYAGTDGAGVFKTTNGATSWSAASNGIANANVRHLAFDQSKSSTLYAATLGGGLFKSVNGGASWTSASSGLKNPYVYDVEIDPGNSAVVYAGTDGGGVFKSTDGGASWTDISIAPNSVDAISAVRALAIDPGDSSILYAATFGTGLFKSSNGGVFWTSVNNSGLTDPHILAIAVSRRSPTRVNFYAGTEGGVFISQDSGLTWNQSNTGLVDAGGGAPHFVISLAVDPSNSAVLYAGTLDAGIFKSTDAGSTWHDASAGLTGNIIYSVAIDPTNPSTLYVGTSHDGVFKSTNGGGFWSTAIAGLPINPVNSVGDLGYSVAIDPNNPAAIYAGTPGNGVFKSANAGTGWNPTGSN